MANKPRYTQSILRDVLVILDAEPSGTLPFGELISRLEATFVPNDVDSGRPRYKRSDVAWVDYAIDTRTAYRRVGWLSGTPDVWTITSRGREALSVYSSPEQLRIAARDGISEASRRDEHGSRVSATVVQSSVDAGGPEDSSDERYDEAHVEAIRKLVMLMDDFTSETGLAALADYPLREAIYFWWRRREFKRTGALYASKYPTTVPWSPMAAAKAKASKRCGGLIIEHVIPNNVTRQLLRDAVDDPVAFREVLDSELFYVVTKEEDDQINDAGYMSSIPDSGDPLDRYRLAGLDPSTYRPLDEH